MFSLVKTNNCLRIHVLTRNACLHLAHVSSHGVSVLNFHMRPQLAYVSSPGEYVVISNRCECLSMSPPLLHTKNHAPTIPGSSPLKAWTLIVVWTDANYAAPFKGISIRSTPEIVLYLNEATRKRR